MMLNVYVSYDYQGFKQLKTFEQLHVQHIKYLKNKKHTILKYGEQYISCSSFFQNFTKSPKSIIITHH